jgi:UDP-N-acetylmuramoyl-tripeptide--D-alanyl-D-alanine ligase
MKAITINDILKATGGKHTAGDPGMVVSNISTDSRTIGAGDFFVPIRGRNFDGHDYVHDVLDKKAVGYLFEKGKQPAFADPPGVAAVEVLDTLTAYGDIARACRRGFTRLKVIGVTGSNGKTTTKDMIACLLERRRRVLKTVGTLNNLVGLPRTMLEIGDDTDVAVLEMGMSALGEIDRLSRIALPDIGVITNVGYTHLEFLGSIENVARGKSELLHGLKKDGVIILNADDLFADRIAHLAKQRKHRVVYFGINKAADYAASQIKENGSSVSFVLVCAGTHETFRLTMPFVGRHNVYNALAAIAACREYGLSFEEIVQGVRTLRLPKMRLERASVGGVTVINDAYNANPSSVQAALQTFDKMETAEKKALVFGDMLELGNFSDVAHAEAGGAVARSTIEVFITIGAQARKAAVAARAVARKELRVYECESKEQILKILSETLRPGDAVMFKGSRGNKLEEVVDAYTRLKTAARP